MKRTTLEGRVGHSQKTVYPFHKIVRAELERLARQVRKLDTTLGAFYGAGAVVIRRRDVLALLKEAKR